MVYCRLPISNCRLKTGKRLEVHRTFSITYKVSSHIGKGGGLCLLRLFNRQSAIENRHCPYLFSSTSTYSASITLSSPGLPDEDDAPAAEACSPPPAASAPGCGAC